MTPGGREKVTQINVCIANKQMHGEHKDPSSPSKVIKMLKRQKKDIHKEQGKTKHEAPCSVNNRGIRNNKKNNRTTALERSVVYTTVGLGGGAGEGVQCLSLYKLHPGSRYNA